MDGAKNISCMEWEEWSMPFQIYSRTGEAVGRKKRNSSERGLKDGDELYVLGESAMVGRTGMIEE